MARTGWIIGTSIRKRKSGSIWRAVLRYVNPDGTKTSYYCEHAHETRERARECAVETLAARSSTNQP